MGRRIGLYVWSFEMVHLVIHPADEDIDKMAVKMGAGALAQGLMAITNITEHTYKWWLEPCGYPKDLSLWQLNVGVTDIAFVVRV